MTLNESQVVLLWNAIGNLSVQLSGMVKDRNIQVVQQQIANMSANIERIRQYVAEDNLSKGQARFVDLVGTTQDFYGTDGNKIKLGDYVFEVKEDDNDGYRSSLGEIVPAEGKFPSSAYCRVRIEEVNIRVKVKGEDRDKLMPSYQFYMDSGYVLRDVQSNEILTAFGTDNEDDYYPSFVFWGYDPIKKQLIG
jgi:hypothetical protein